MAEANPSNSLLGIGIILLLISGITSNYNTFCCSLIILQICTGYLLTCSIFEQIRNKTYNAINFLTDKCRILFSQILILLIFMTTIIIFYANKSTNYRGFMFDMLSVSTCTANVLKVAANFSNVSIVHKYPTLVSHYSSRLFQSPFEFLSIVCSQLQLLFVLIILMPTIYYYRKSYSQLLLNILVLVSFILNEYFNPDFVRFVPIFNYSILIGLCVGVTKHNEDDNKNRTITNLILSSLSLILIISIAFLPASILKTQICEFIIAAATVILIFNYSVTPANEKAPCLFTIFENRFISLLGDVAVLIYIYYIPFLHVYPIITTDLTELTSTFTYFTLPFSLFILLNYKCVIPLCSNHNHISNCLFWLILITFQLCLVAITMLLVYPFNMHVTTRFGNVNITVIV
jgi:hypothetical protein